MLTFELFFKDIKEMESVVSDKHRYDRGLFDASRPRAANVSIVRPQK